MPSNAAECYVSFRMEEGYKWTSRDRICSSLPERFDYDGRDYCILHFPSDHKSRSFEDEIQRRLKAGDYFFDGVYFPRSFSDLVSPHAVKGMSFRWATFNEGASFLDREYAGKVDFTNAHFYKSTTFRSKFEDTVYFLEASFLGPVDFSNSSFHGNAHFNHAYFDDRATVSSTKFEKEASFGAMNITESGELRFTGTQFHDLVEFGSSIVRGRLHVLGGEVLFDPKQVKPVSVMFHSDKARLGVSNLIAFRPEHVRFQNLELRPNWFVEADCRKFAFSNIRWKNLTGDTRNSNVRAELSQLQDFRNPSVRLSRTCRDIEANYEETRDFETASKFRYLAHQTDRLRHKLHGWFWTLTWWYWLSSGYGERRLRAAAVLIALLLAFSGLFASRLSTFEDSRATTNQSDPVGIVEKRVNQMGFANALSYTLSLVTFQRPEPKPANLLTTISASLLMLLAPLQFALLVFAVRRKFLK